MTAKGQDNAQGREIRTSVTVSIPVGKNVLNLSEGVYDVCPPRTQDNTDIPGYRCVFTCATSGSDFAIGTKKRVTGFVSVFKLKRKIFILGKKIIFVQFLLMFVLPTSKSYIQTK